MKSLTLRIVWIFFGSLEEFKNSQSCDCIHFLFFPIYFTLHHSRFTALIQIYILPNGFSKNYIYIYIYLFFVFSTWFFVFSVKDMSSLDAFLQRISLSFWTLNLGSTPTCDAIVAKWRFRSLYLRYYKCNTYIWVFPKIGVPPNHPF